MTTKQTVLNYYSAIHAENWQDYISDKLAYGFNSAEPVSYTHLTLPTNREV